MARAKRTDRAEARRRYRATLIEDEPTDGLDDDVEEPASEPARASSRDRVRAASTAPTPPPRPSITRAFSASFTKLDARGDIAALPSLVRHRSFLIPLALLAAVSIALTVTGGNEPIIRALATYFLLPPPVAPVFIAGFMAKRASWLQGAILGGISWLVLLGMSAGTIEQLLADPKAAEGLSVPGLIASNLAISVVGGALFASVAAWYKRFLFLANPARAARANARANDRQQRRRGSQNRPVLARRR